ncbi:sterol desaturase family protein [Oleisolibacter albus]|uniref:sterol desaturase family protein n=1 Tax=Oleisolibacter albus TaxID=2171757 RepID=UPI000DF33A7D|nr:sterol desaturase family protein [Oleisolibacter albus]
MWGDAWKGRSYDLGKMTLKDLAIAYWTYPAIQVYAALALVSAGLAIVWAQNWGLIALTVLVASLVYPLAWYGIHRWILHGRWLYRMRWTAALWKRIHFDHHQDPHKLEVLFGSLANTLPTIALITLPVGWLIDGRAGAATALSTGLATTCVYEFFHCIQHLNYKPRWAWVVRIKQLHLQHHFHNEDGNYGIVSYLPDMLFGTYYSQARQRPRSPHVFNLGYDLAEAGRYPWVMTLTGAPPRDRPPRAGEGAGAGARTDAKAAS